jgi:hypothetical protein
VRLSLEILLAGASVVDISGGRVETPQWPGVHRSYRGPRTGRRDMRVAREPERPCLFRRDRRPGFRLTNSRSRARGSRAMVPNQSTSRAGFPATHAESEAWRTLRILRDYRQRICVVTIPVGCRRTLEEMAWPSPPRRRNRLGANASSAEAVSVSASDRRPLGVPSSSESLK